MVENKKIKYKIINVCKVAVARGMMEMIVENKKSVLVLIVKRKLTHFDANSDFLDENRLFKRCIS